MHYDITKPDELETLIAELELIRDGKPVSQDKLQKLRDLKSGAIMTLDLLKRGASSVEISERGHYTIGLIEEILHRDPQSPVYADPKNLLYAASAYSNAGRNDLTIPLLDECAEKHSKLREYAQKMKDELTPEQ